MTNAEQAFLFADVLRAARERRLEGKTRVQRVKRLRGRPRWDE